MDDKIKNGSDKTGLMLRILREANGKPVTTGELMEALECNRNSVNNHYKRCIQCGNRISKVKVGHETGFVIENKEMIYRPLTTDMVRKYLIMQKVKPGTAEKQKLLGTNYRKRDEEYGIRSELGNISVSKYYELISELETEGELRKIQDRYYPARNNIPVAWEVNDEEAGRYLDILSMMPPGHHSQKQIESIYRKISSLFEVDEKDDSSYVVLGRVYTVLNRIRELLSVLGTVDYINKLILVNYTGSGGSLIEQTLAVGLVVYSVEKDKIYLLGEKRGTGTDVRKKSAKKDNIVFIDVEKIRGVREEKGRNRSYHNQKYMTLFQQMFSMEKSPLNEVKDEKTKVTVAFVNEPYIRDRLENLCKCREKSGANIKTDEEELIYSDNVLGVSDFFRFLRPFTGKYRILDSNRLNDMKKDSIERMIKNYKGD